MMMSVIILSFLLYFYKIFSFTKHLLWFLALDRLSCCLNHFHDLVFTKYCSLYYLSFLNSLSLITTCSLSAYLSFSLLHPVTHSFWDLQSINLSDSFTFLSCLLPSLASLLLTPWSLFSSLSSSLYVVSLVTSCTVLSLSPQTSLLVILESSFLPFWVTLKSMSAQCSFRLSSALPVLILPPNRFLNHFYPTFFFLLSLLPGLPFILVLHPFFIQKVSSNQT